MNARVREITEAVEPWRKIVSGIAIPVLAFLGYQVWDDVRNLQGQVSATTMKQAVLETTNIHTRENLNEIRDDLKDIKQGMGKIWEAVRK